MKSSASLIKLYGMLLMCFGAACKGNPGSTASPTSGMSIKQETVTYTSDTVTMNGFVAYNQNDTGKRPVILIVHEWWGQNEYVKNRARQLASLGYIAMAVDIYGNGKTAENPEQAKALAMPFYQNPQMAKQRFDAAFAKIKTYPVADTNNVAAIGYCFGGGLVLNAARLGSHVKGVVSFHGSLLGTPVDKNLLKADVLVCHGEADKFVPAEEVAQFKKQMDSVGASYTFKSYAGATHAFTNPDATENGKKFSIPIAYNAAADTASFKDMQDFLKKLFR